MSALSPHRLAKIVRSIRRSPPPFGTQEIPPPQANLAHPGLPISSNLFLAPMVSAHSKQHIQQPPTSNVDALPNALQNKHSPSDRKILKKTGSPDLLLAKRAGCIRGTTSSTARRRGRQYCFRGFNCGSCVAALDFFPMERNGLDCWRSARSWHEIFSPLRQIAAVRTMQVDCSSRRND